MAKQDLHGPQVARSFVDQRGFCSPHRMRAIFAAIEPDRCYPLDNKACVLPGAEMAHIIDPAWKDEIEDRATTALQPGLQAPACLCHDLELNRSTGLLLDNRRAISNVATADDVTNPELDEITASQLAVDRQIEQRSIAHVLSRAKLR